MAREALHVGVLSASLAWRDGIAAQLSAAEGIQCTGVTAIEELGRLVRTPDVVIVDAPDNETLEGLLQADAPAMPFVILSDEPDRELGARLLLAGSVAILERHPSTVHLLAAVRAAVSGLATLSTSHVAAFMDATTNVDSPGGAEWIQPLTPRELQILRMLSDGAANKSIAAQLQISEHTAKFHVGQILAKLGAESRTEAVTIGIRQGLIMI